MARPPKIKTPIGLDVWLRLALRGKGPEDRMKIFREWRREYLRINLKREPKDQEIEAEIKKWQQVEFYLSNKEMNWMDILRMDFLPAYHKENRKRRAQIAATKSWSKENREKRKLQNREKNQNSHLTGISYALFASSISKPASSKK